MSSEALHIAQKNDTTNETTAQVIADIEQSNDPATIGTYIEEVIWLTPQDKSILISAVAVGSLVLLFSSVSKSAVANSNNQLSSFFEYFSVDCKDYGYVWIWQCLDKIMD